MVTRSDPSPWRPYRHLLEIDRVLIEARQGLHKIIILQVPVRHGKTTLASVALAAWWLGNWPDEYVAAFSSTFEIARDLIGSPSRQLFENVGEPIFGQRIDTQSNASHRWGIEGHAGGFVCGGVGGKIEGRGFNLVAIDDPIGSPAEAESARSRGQLFRWYQGALSTRLSVNGVVVLSMARWHKNDLAGQLIQEGEATGGIKPYVLDMPALALPADQYADAKAGDPLGRAVGEALCPQLRSREYLLEQRTRVGQRFFAARFQGRPQDATGSFFKQTFFRYFAFDQRSNDLIAMEIAGAKYDEAGVPIAGVERPRRVPFTSLRWRQYVDLASSKREQADYFVVTTVAIDITRLDLFVMNVFRARLSGPEQIPALRVQQATWNVPRQMIEAVAYQHVAVDNAVAAGLPAFPITRGRGDKLQRAQYLGVRYEQGCVYHPQRAPWLKDFEDELLSFPFGAHDDQVDTCADAANDMQNVVTEEDVAGAGAAASYVEV